MLRVSELTREELEQLLEQFWPLEREPEQENEEIEDETTFYK